MKFHCNFKTVLISLLIIIIFFLSSIFLLFEFNLTSPTLLFTDKLISSLSSTNEDFSLSFSSLERNFSSRVMVNDLSLSYRGENIADFDTVEVKLGIFDIISLLIGKNGNAIINFNNGKIYLPDSIISDNYSSSTNSISSSSLTDDITSFIKEHNIVLSFTNTNLYSSALNLEKVDLALSLLGEENSLVGELYIPYISFDYNSYSINSNSASLSFTLSDSFFVKADIDSLNFETDEIETNVNSIILSASLNDINNFSLDKLNAHLLFNDAGVRVNDYLLHINPSELTYSGDLLLFSLSSINFDYFNYSAHLDKIEGSLTCLNSLKVGLSSFNILEEKRSVVEGEDLIISGELDKRELDYKISNISSLILSDLSTSVLDEARLINTQGSIILSDNIELTLETATTIKNNIDILSDTNFDLNASMMISDSSLSDITLNIKNLDLGFGEKKIGSIIYSGNSSRGSVDIDSEEINGNVNIDLNKKSIRGLIDLNSLVIKDYLPLIGYSDTPFLSDDSSLNISLNFDLFLNNENYLGFGGLVNYSLLIQGIEYLGLSTSFNNNATLRFTNERINISSFSFDTSILDGELSGYFDLNRLLPQLDFSLSIDGGEEIVNGYLQLNSDKSYSYYCGFTTFDNTYLNGELDFNLLSSIKSMCSFNTPKRERIFNINIDIENKDISVLNDNFSFSINYSDGLYSSLIFDSFEIFGDDENKAITIDGSLDYSLLFDKGFRLNSSLLKIENIYLLPASPTVSFYISGDDNSIDIKELEIYNDSNRFTGLLKVDFIENYLVGSLEEENGSAELLLSLYKDEEYSGILRLNNVSLNSFGARDMFLNLNLIGSAKEIEDFSFVGSLDINSRIDNSIRLSSYLALDSTSLKIDNIAYTSNSINLIFDDLFIDALTGSFGLKNATIDIKNEHQDRDYPISSSFSFSGLFDKSDSLFSSLFTLYQNNWNNISLSFILNNLSLDNEKVVLNKAFDLNVNNSHLAFNGSLLNGNIDLIEKNIDVELDVDSLISLSLNGSFKNKINANANISAFNMSLVNLFMTLPVVTMYDDIAKGEVAIREEEDGLVLNGFLYLDELNIDVYWLENQRLTVHNPRFSIWDNELKSVLTSATVTNYETLERKRIDIDIAAALTKGLSLDYYAVDLYIPEDNPIIVRLPIPQINIDILTDCTGHYRIQTIDGVVYNLGELNLSNLNLSVGMNPYPDWYNYLTGTIGVDMKMNFVRNNRILYPSSLDPIFSIMLSDKSFVDLSLNPDSFSVNGDISIRGGEIFYFQKYFFITSGSIIFDDPNVFNPKISLRATLRDYTADNERVEIFLVMKDNTFDNLSPTLESSPVMELNEIMSILGQNILPQSAYGNVSFGSVASLVTEGFDILSRLGIVANVSNPLSSLSTSLKEAFGVDSFSLHSNILNNIITDSITSATSAVSNEYSMMARFLSGTTLNLGKYITQNLYLQALVYLQTTSDNSAYTIISDDLSLDTEISLEWSNDAFNVTFFTSPQYLSLYSFIDNFGFSISKTINF